MKIRFSSTLTLSAAACVSLFFGQAVANGAVTVLTVPWVATNPTSPHTTYPTGVSSEVTIVLGATVPSAVGSSDSFTYSWSFGDGSAPTAAAPVTNPYDISVTHQYPFSAAGGTTWTAVVTVTDTTTTQTGTAKYYVIQEANNLQSRVNVAIDFGLWYQHQTEWRTTTVVSGGTVNIGGWDNTSASPGCVSGAVNCSAAGAIDAASVQAYEVNGHLESGPAADPYTDDVARGLARMMYFLNPESTSYLGAKSVTYNPAVMAARCSDGSTPNFTNNPPTCSTGTLIQYNPTATSCTSPPCSESFDQNTNGQLLVTGNDSYGLPGYQMGQFLDALVATSNPAGTAKAGSVAGGGLPGVFGQSYQNIVTDLADGILYCQYYADFDDGADTGYDAGGGWQYNCAATSSPNYDDNSISQWNAIGLIGAQRGFGLAVPAITKDTNQVWVAYSQEYADYDWSSFLADGGDLKGAFGYDEYGYEPWGPFADTPSGMVQMAMDGVGRTAAGASDQRWNMAETFYRDNFCNGQTYSPQSSYYDYNALYAPRWYTYGMFSFTKSMLLHDPQGVLTPISLLEDEPSGTNPINWYSALSAANGGSDPCDGVAQTLVSRQSSTGYWSGYNYTSTQFPFETAWALIMLQRTVFVTCISNVSGVGSPALGAPARIDLEWGAQSGANSYNVLRSATNGGPYSLIGNTTLPSYEDENGLSNGKQYFYVVQPQNGAGSICQSNQAAITVPNPSTGGRR